MDTFNGKIPVATSRKTSTWADDSGSTVGFARLQEEEGVLSPIEMQRSVYGAAPIGAAASAGMGGGENKLKGMGIMKGTTIDQRSEVVR